MRSTVDVVLNKIQFVSMFSHEQFEDPVCIVHLQ